MLGRFTKKYIFANRVKNFHIRACKKILGVSIYVNNIKVLTELGRTPLSINIEKQMSE